MKLPNSEHTNRPWRIHELTWDFRVEDVWGMQVPGHAGDFATAVQRMASMDPATSSSRAVRLLFALRWKLGEILGWDDPADGVGGRVPSLCARLPADLREHPGPAFAALPFTPLYLFGNEFAAEAANKTMHGVMHLGLVADDSGGFRCQMAVLVKRNGLFGDAYMAAIRPVRHLVVYPPLTRELERAWRTSDHSTARLETG